MNSSGDQWKAQRATTLEILRELNMGKNPLAEKIQEEVGEYVKAICAKDSQPFDLTPLTQMSVSNNICSIIFGKRYEYDDEVFCPKFAQGLGSAQNTHLLVVMLCL